MADQVPGARRVIQLHPTLRCNLACRHCYSTSGPAQRAALPVRLLLDVVEDAATLGFDVIAVSGGEPFLYPHLTDVLRHARSVGLRTAVTTNGTCLGGGRLTAAAPWLDFLAVSCDGPPALHDDVRADTTAFRRLLRGLDHVRAAEVPFGLIHTLTRRSWPELGWLAGFAAEQGAGLLQLHPIEAAGRARDGADLCLTGAELAKAWLVTRALAVDYRDRLRVHVDVMTRRTLLDSAEPPDVDTLVVEADGVVVPFTYGLSRAFAVTDLTRRRLRDAWPRFATQRVRGLQRAARADCLAEDGHLFNWFETLVRRSYSVRPLPGKDSHQDSPRQLV